MNSMNLIPASRLRARQERRLLIRWSVWLGAYAATVAVASAALHFSNAIAPDSIDAKMVETSQMTTRAETRRKDTLQEISDLERRLDAANTVGRHPDWSLLLLALASVRGEDVMLESIDLTTSRPDPSQKTSALRPPNLVQGPDSAASAAPGDKSKPADKSKAGTGEKDKANRSSSFAIKLTGFGRNPGKVFEFARSLEQFEILDQVKITQTRASQVGSLSLTWFELTTGLSEQSRPVPPARSASSGARP